MGDHRRFQIVADIIKNNFKPCKVSDIAGGDGTLSLLLSSLGFECTVIDPRKSSHNTQYTHRRTYFSKEMAEKYDLLIGLHPDEATEEIFLASWIYKKPALIIPCCNHWANKTNADIHEEIRRFLKKSAIPYRLLYLPMIGKNVAYLFRA